MADENECCEKEKVNVLREDKVNSTTNNMDTEFDRQCAKAMVALNHSRGEIERSGLSELVGGGGHFHNIQTLWGVIFKKLGWSGGSV